MFNSQVLEIAIGLCLVFLVASLLASGLREVIESVLKTRAIQLERGLRQLLDDPTGAGTTKELYDHPQVFGLFDGVYDPAKLTRFWRGWRTDKTEHAGETLAVPAKRLPFASNFPSYMPSRNVAVALLDMIGAGEAQAQGAPLMETLRANAATLQPGRVRDALLATLSEAGNDFDRARTSLEAWFDSGMDRVSGWYKRESQALLLALGLATAIAFNIDAFHIGRQLATNNTVRQQIVVQAETLRQSVAARRDAQPTGEQAGPGREDLKRIVDDTTGLSTLIGWPKTTFAPRDPAAWANWASMMIGWIITALAISLGAPFWFDLLNKIMVVRATVKPYEKSPPEGSEDRKGGRSAADRLEPSGGGGAAAANGQGQTQAQQAQLEGDHVGHVRLAVDTADVASLVVTVGGERVQLPPDGFVELPLKLGVDYRLEARGERSGTPVGWAQTVRLTYEDDLAPIHAELA